MTTAQLHDSQACDALIQGDPHLPQKGRPSMPTLRGLLAASLPGIGSKASWPSMAYDDGKRRERLKARGIKPRILYKARRNKPLTTWQTYFNKTAAVRPGGGRAPIRADERALPLRPLSLFGPRPQRRPPSALRRRLQPQNGHGAGPMRPNKGRGVPDHRKKGQNAMT